MSTDALLSACLEVAEAAARDAGRMIREAHEKRAAAGLSIESKGSAATQTVDLVTATDKACEDRIIGAIKGRFPDHAFIGEESSFTGPGGSPTGPLELTDTPTWIVDPLDGTTNFVHGYPLVTVSIGLAVGKQLVLGVEEPKAIVEDVVVEDVDGRRCGSFGGAALGGWAARGRKMRCGRVVWRDDGRFCHRWGRCDARMSPCSAELNDGTRTAH